MRMVYTGADEEEFIDARQRLLVELDAWSQMRQRVVDPVVAGAMLDFRFERDGLLGRWTRDILRNALLVWFPRKVVLLDPHSSAVLSTVEALMDFFDDADLLDERSEQPAVLRTYLTAIADRFDTAMNEPSNFGLAKFWAVAMAEHGIDPLNEVAAQAFIDRVRRGEVEVDQTLLHDLAYRHYQGDPDAEAAAPSPVFPLASAERLAAEAEVTAVVPQLRRFVEWIGEGRDLAEISAPAEFVTMAKRAGVVRVYRGRLVPVKKAARRLADPVELWRAAVGSILANPLAAEMITELAAEPATIPMLVEMLGGDGSTILRVVARLAEYGLVEIFPAGEEHYEDLLDFAGVDYLDEVPEEERQVVRLLPLGVQAAYELRVAEGEPVLTVADLAGETAEVLFARLAPLDAQVLDEGAATWLRARDPERAIAELSALARRTDDFEHRMLTFRLLARLGGDGVAAIAGLRDHSAAGPAALTWLFDAGLIDRSEVAGRDRTYSKVDLLAADIRTEGREKALADFASQPRPDQLLFLAGATICGHPSAREVLESVVVAHPDRAVSNAARKALDWLHDEPF
ncbi:hypothetical protein L1857_02815 [Amycolatopsis thermalba]|uniref:Uncharacterized protein n=1 Tax=Amycolatopsis thermalba TaxID=944492 RepID=A0ABY4NQE2_9PSEU|nr:MULTISPECIES: hypothetical protein [Amycolatopsis]OXM74507.1 hypothetical protein CF166_04650 [Amycolatopsis sp. KNN50.9b]UQS21827.1 hypothetical protein L1857_02815 [Amycolatopsis thermalba]